MSAPGGAAERRPGAGAGTGPAGRELPPRRGHPARWVVVDSGSLAWRRRNVFGLLLLAVITFAALFAFVAKVVLPWAIYPAL